MNSIVESPPTPFQRVNDRPIEATAGSHTSMTWTKVGMPSISARTSLSWRVSRLSLPPRGTEAAAAERTWRAARSAMRQACGREERLHWSTLGEELIADVALRDQTRQELLREHV